MSAAPQHLLVYAYVMAPHVYAALSRTCIAKAALRRGVLHGQVMSDFRGAAVLLMLTPHGIALTPPSSCVGLGASFVPGLFQLRELGQLPLY
jgi:hypothetical protein